VRNLDLKRLEKQFRDEHAISRDIWEERPFERYFRDRTEAKRIKRLYDGSGLRPGQLGDITKIVMNDRKDAEGKPCEGGFVIHRRAPRGLELEPVYPQLRPDVPVAREWISHSHADEPPPEWPRHLGTDNPIPAFRIYLKPAEGWGLSVRRHIDRGKDGRKAHADENLHRGANCQELHSHLVLAKYVFPSTPLKEISGNHRHADIDDLEALLAHVEKQHKNDDAQSFPDIYALHAWSKDVKDRDKPLAMRLDVEPRFYELLSKSNVVGFGIEGSVKGSALTSAGWPTVTVPSVGMWLARELDGAACRYLIGKVVVIVPDNDWYANPAVVAQAFLCRTYLRRRLNIWALIAAPPADMFENGNLVKVGVDDYLACGGDLLEMDVIDRDADIELYREWIAARLPRKSRARRRDWIETLAVALEGFALHASSEGQVELPYATLATVMGLHEKQVERAARDLLECEALTSNIDVTVRRGIYTPYGNGRGRYDPLGLEFAHRPTFTVAAELRVTDRSTKLRKVLDDSPKNFEYLTAAQRYDWLAGQGVKTAVGDALRKALPE
jgi:hypothetical protein